MVDLFELSVHVETLEVDEFILEVSHSEEVLHLVPHLVEDATPRVIRVLIGERRLGEGKSLVKVHSVTKLVHLYGLY